MSKFHEYKNNIVELLIDIRQLFLIAKQSEPALRFAKLLFGRPYTLQHHSRKHAMSFKFKWEDPFFLSQQLSDDERAIVEAAHDFCQDKLQTRVLMAARHETFDREIMTEAGAMVFWVPRLKATAAPA
jgi:hypothetical protein